MHIDIGIDPDSNSHGCAIAINKKLTTLVNMTLVEVMQFIVNHKDHKITFHIEDVTKQNSIFKKDGVKSAKADKEVARSVGMMQQSFKELVRVIEHVRPDATIKLYPLSKRWKKSAEGKPRLEQVWGYTGKSNEDTRSAAYFLTLGCR